jgi:hypothetical protein
VAHKGKKELVVDAFGDRYSVDFGSMAHQMTEEIHKKVSYRLGLSVSKLVENHCQVVDPALRDWILPKFTTTTLSDTVICSIQMMSTLKAYVPLYQVKPELTTKPDISITCSILSVESRVSARRRKIRLGRDTVASLKVGIVWGRTSCLGGYASTDHSTLPCFLRWTTRYRFLEESGPSTIYVRV